MKDLKKETKQKKIKKKRQDKQINRQKGGQTAKKKVRIRANHKFYNIESRL